MHFVRVVPAFLLLACGGGGSNNPPNPDGPRPDTQQPDGPTPDGQDPDGPPDGPPASTVARVWAVGDILENNVDIVGGFAADATLPFNTANPPTLKVPAAGEISTQTDQTFDARGSKIAFIADATVAGRLDLNVADADGSNPIVVIEGGVAGIEISSLALSPDGTKVAFTMDSAAVNNGVDLYVAPTTAAATPVLISPARAAGSLDTQDVFSQYTWSADSKFVAFSADLTENGVDQAYVTDTSVATPGARRAAPPQRRHRHHGVARAARSRAVRREQQHVLPGAAVRRVDPVHLLQGRRHRREDGDRAARARRCLDADIGAFGVSPDGATLVFSADAPTLGVFDVYKAATADLANPTKITNITAINTQVLNATFTAPIAFSPDGTKIAVVANFLSGGDNTAEPFVIAMDGSSTKRLAALTTQTNQDTEQLVWTDNATVFALGDIAEANVGALFKLDAAMEDQTPTLAVGMPTGGDLVNVFVVLPQ